MCLLFAIWLDDDCVSRELDMPFRMAVIWRVVHERVLVVATGRTETRRRVLQVALLNTQFVDLFAIRARFVRVVATVVVGALVCRAYVSHSLWHSPVQSPDRATRSLRGA
ncbi:hypothetical protein BpHYR1_038104 [Brachionus plicatilis]|uniref:Uncharacterized protein n=1 Tax=Brachionus plicatilis TaxID=10195 RepID=A0A3M7Q366_BRAPC|nr:hypothetical protein BpHYR1_038104 [Brachionus plicatilis]